MTHPSEQTGLISQQAAASDGRQGTFNVLMVCTGNICRSPAAQLLWEASLGGVDQIAATSAGTMALVGEPVSEPIGALLRRRGIDPGGFRAHLLTDQDVKAADLVLGMTRMHRGRAVSLWPAAVRRSFTLKEFARLITQVPPEELAALAGSASPSARLTALTQLAGRYRAPVRETLDDVADPYRRSQEVNQRAFDEIEHAVAAIVSMIMDR